MYLCGLFRPVGPSRPVLILIVIEYETSDFLAQKTNKVIEVTFSSSAHYIRMASFLSHAN